MFTQRVNALTGAVEWAAATGAGAAGAAAAVGASSHVRARTGAERTAASARVCTPVSLLRVSDALPSPSLPHAAGARAA